jgi:hypothetical protein
MFSWGTEHLGVAVEWQGQKDLPDRFCWKRRSSSWVFQRPQAALARPLGEIWPDDTYSLVLLLTPLEDRNGLLAGL